MDLMGFLKDKCILIKDKILFFLKALHEEIVNIENKKKFAMMVCSWLMVFASIIVISNIKDKRDENYVVKALAETESVSEMSLANIFVESVVAKKETIVETSVVETTEVIIQETSEFVEEETIEVEKETIPFEKIEVFEEQLHDDAIITTQKAPVIYSEPGEKKSSKTMDEYRFANCIDVSKHQGDINWKAVKESGIDYAIIRVAYRGYETGKIAKDTKFEKNIKEALANDIEVGVYFFSQATNKFEALEEASVILKYIKGYNITLPVVIDWETAPGYRTYSGIGKSELTDIISIFCDTVSKHGYEPMVYMCQTDFTGRVYGKKLSEKYKIWVAWYFEAYAKKDKKLNIFKYGQDIPDLSYNYDVWQYSKNGYVKGISTPVDMNVYILPKKKPQAILSVEDEKIVIDYNDKEYDVLSSVKLVDLSGVEINDKVEYLLKNDNSKPVSIEEAINNPGKYIITYYYEDNPEIIKDVELHVRDIPDMYFDKVIWNIDEVKYVDYEYDNNVDFDTNMNSLKIKINSNIEFMGHGVKQNIKYENFYGELIDAKEVLTAGQVLDGEYEFKYKIEIFENILFERIIKVNISNSGYEETETETEIDFEENTEINFEGNGNTEVTNDIEVNQYE